MVTGRKELDGCVEYLRASSVQFSSPDRSYSNDALSKRAVSLLDDFLINFICILSSNMSFIYIRK